MGSCLGPALAIFFLFHLICIYKDDIYAVFESDSASKQVLDILNSRHKDIKFPLKKIKLR